MHKFSYLLFFLLVATLIIGCTKDSLPEPEPSDCEPGLTPTYAADIEEIIERSCSYSGCHLGGAPGVYNNYEGLLPDLESGLFRERTITLRADPIVGMPPNYAPDGHPQSLTEEELRLVECWLEGGYPKE